VLHFADMGLLPTILEIYAKQLDELAPSALQSGDAKKELLGDV